MKVTFLIPPVLDGTHNVDRCSGCNYNIYFLPLLPVLYAATVVKNHVERVSIVDFPAHKRTRKDFENNSSGAYQWLLKNNYRKKIHEIFPPQKINWTLETALEEAKKYKTRKEFTKKSSGACKWFSLKGYSKELDKIFPRKCK